MTLKTYRASYWQNIKDKDFEIQSSLGSCHSAWFVFFISSSPYNCCCIPQDSITHTHQDVLLKVEKLRVSWFRQLPLGFRNISSCLKSVAHHWKNPYMTYLGQLVPCLKWMGFGHLHFSNLVDALKLNIVAQVNSERM